MAPSKKKSEVDPRVVELEQTAKRLQRQLADAKAKTADLISAVHSAAHEAAVIVGKPSPVKITKRDRRAGKEEAALLHLTDWQLGKETESYSSDICERRVEEAIWKTVHLSDIQRRDHPVKECHVMLGGDLVENVDTFPLQAWEVDSTVFEQVFRASALVEKAVITLLENFDKVVVWEVSGNHGRIGRKGQYPRQDNFDRIVGKIARDRLSQQRRLEWHVPNSWYQIVEVGNYKAMLVHGDQIKSFGGNVPHYGISKKANAWSSGVVEPFNDLYLGHMHQVIQVTLAKGGRAFMTGSTESGSEYAREFMGASGRPSQRLHFVDPERGRVSAEYVLWLD
jgi:hypothetical protein